MQQLVCSCIALSVSWPAQRVLALRGLEGGGLDLQDLAHTQKGQFFRPLLQDTRYTRLQFLQGEVRSKSFLTLPYTTYNGVVCQPSSFFSGRINRGVSDLTSTLSVALKPPRSRISFAACIFSFTPRSVGFIIACVIAYAA
jgi:hypothetical protein